MKSPFVISPRVIAHLGEDLIRNESIALLELVKNSYDANATLCSVKFITDENGTMSRIVICDNGCGMDKDTIEKRWLVIGTDNKRGAIPLPGERWPLGEKGIGRLGVHKLGRKICMTSKTSKGKEVVVSIDWNGLKKANSIEEFYIDVIERDEPSVFKNGQVGTEIIIEDLKCEWTKRQLRAVYRDLNSLNSPFGHKNDSFKVIISSNANLFDGLPDIEEIFSSGMYKAHCRMEGNVITEFNYEFSPWKTLEKLHGGRTVTLADLKADDVFLKGIEERPQNGRASFYDIDLNTYDIGPIEFDIVIFERDRSIWNYAPIEKTSFDEYLRENGGIRVYRDDIRVYNYGERDNDWLGIDLQRIKRMGSYISNNIVVGAVQLNRSLSSGLREKTNREGFIEDDAYRIFTDSVNYVLSLVVRLRMEDRDKFISIYKTKPAGEPVLEDLNNIAQLVEQKIADDDIKKEILKYINRANEKYIEVRDILLKSANAGLNLSMVIHELEKQIASLKGCAERGERENIIIISKRLEDLVRRHSVILRKSEIKTISLAKVVNTALSDYNFRFLDHHITIYNNCNELDLKVRSSEAETVGAVINLLDNAIYWVSASRHEDRKIAVTITDQIDGYYSIVVSDNGPGFNIGTELAIKPFVTGKPHNYGMGLGLHVVNEIMNAVNGKLVFLEKDEICMPSYVDANKINSSIIALCFKKA